MADNFISGQVVEGGDPVENATVEAILQDGSEVLRTVTDTNGEYIFEEEDLADGTNDYHVVARDEVSGTYYRALSQPFITAEGSAIPDSVVFPESDDLTHFGGDTGAFDINSSEPKFNTEFTDLSLKFTGASLSYIGSTSGLNNYPEVGQPHRVAFYNGSGDSRCDIMFSTDSTSTHPGTGYGIHLRPRDDDMMLRRWDSGSTTNLDTTISVGYTIGEWHELEILHESNGDVTGTVFDKDGTQLATVSANDLNHITNGSYDNVGVGLRQVETNTDDAWDFWRFVE